MKIKPNDYIKCVTSFDSDLFAAGCLYQIYSVNKNGTLNTFDDEGDLATIDFPHDEVYGKFELKT